MDAPNPAMLQFRGMPPPAIAVAILDDLFFTAKIREAARLLGVELTVVRDPSVLHQGPAPIVLLLDLDSKKVDPFAALDVVRHRPDAGKECPAIAFATSIGKDLANRAKNAGVTQLLERSEFTEKLADILRSVTRGPMPALEVVRGGGS